MEWHWLISNWSRSSCLKQNIHVVTKQWSQPLLIPDVNRERSLFLDVPTTHTNIQWIPQYSRLISSTPVPGYSFRETDRPRIEFLNASAKVNDLVKIKKKKKKICALKPSLKFYRLLLHNLYLSLLLFLNKFNFLQLWNLHFKSV